ncbi:MAG TPA: Xaa-Pro peptidase family protein [Kouleothrix sp.]|uniref:M24 family metallopeptidase n=1 Tax=Kouleothrix sp. TaxID=2779161 RepID=UPI002BC4D74C|nr:Xaa-Pro peptidase family protein [Kouleothrix sp.]
MANTQSQRLDRLRAEMRRAGIDGIALVPGANMRYLAGLDMHMNERLAIAFFPANGQPAMVLPALEQPRAQAQARFPIAFYPWHDGDGPEAAMRQAAADLGLDGARLGVEYTAMRVLELRGIEAAAPEALVGDATATLAALRMAKDADELAAMRRAVSIVEEALRAAIAQIRVGMTERELAELWDAGMRAAGSAPSFGTIVASGPNAANPHHSNTDRAFQPGDLIIMDGGAWFDGYASDITRTVALGLPSGEARRIYELVQAANAAGRAAARPGASGEQIDQAARAAITAGGYGPQFLHRTGHGLGLEVHEPPYIVSGSTSPLVPGMTFTVEPGVYVAGVGGVRIEDDVVITADGAESLTSFERDLIVVEA